MTSAPAPPAPAPQPTPAAASQTAEIAAQDGGGHRCTSGNWNRHQSSGGVDACGIPGYRLAGTSACRQAGDHHH